MSARRSLIAATVFALGVRVLAGQGVPPQSPAAAAQPWTPLAPVADIIRTLPAPPPLPSLLLAAPPEVGLFWSAGNPGSVAFDVQTGRATYAAQWGKTDGAYRRPLDPGAERAGGLELAGWQRVGERGAAAGRVVVQQQELDPSPGAHQVSPYGSSPFVPVDTSVRAVRRVNARFEGVLGWRLGGWGLGAALGYDVMDNRSVASPSPRSGRLAVPAVAVGVARNLFAGLQAGLFARRLERVETYTIYALSATTIVYPIEGLSEPSRRPVDPAAPYYRRYESVSWARGVTVGGRVLGVRWAGFAADESLREEQTSQPQSPNPPVDTWDADGWRAGLAVQRVLPLARALATGRVSYASLSGVAHRNDLEGIIIRGRDRALDALLEIRVALRDSAWQAAVVVGTHFEEQSRSDYLAELQMDVEGWTPGVGIEVARRYAAGTLVSLGWAYARRYAVVTIPNPATKGPIYNRLVAPELSLDAARTSTQTIALTLLQPLRGSTAAWIHVGLDRVAPSLGNGETPLPLTPTGRRNVVALQLGILTR